MPVNNQRCSGQAVFPRQTVAPYGPFALVVAAADLVQVVVHCPVKELQSVA